MKNIPHSIEAEKEIILCLVSHHKLIHDFKDILKPHHFYLPYTAHAYQCLLDMFKANRPIDTSYLIADMELKDKEMDTSWLIDMYFGDEASLNQRVKFVKELSKRRETINKVTSLLHLLYSDKSHDQLLDEIDKSLFEISVLDKKPQSLQTHFINAFDIVNARLDGTNIVKTGFSEIDNMITGILAGQLVILGARTSMGKTSFLLSLLHNVMSLGKGTLFFSLEMPATEIVLKSLSIEAQIPYNAIVNGIHRNNSEAYETITSVAEAIENWPFYIEDSIFSINDIKNTARKIVKEKDIRLIAIDYLGLIEYESKKNANKSTEIADITRALKLLARELNVPIILLCQLNRETDKGDMIPKLHHLRDSGGIEQDGDIVMFLYREYYYNKEADPNEAKIYIAKQRLGPLGEANIHYEPELMHFSNK